ncbi:MAG: SDR family NAD(P)-dependent oxidoreductase [Clostridia bacterium]
MDLHMKDKIVVVTGGATGIGKATALEFLKEGAKVAICGRRKQRLDEVCLEFKDAGFDVFTKSVDVTDYVAFAEFIDDVVKKFGKIDIMINNAGANQIKSLMDYDVEEFKGIIDINLISVFSGCKIAAQHMKKTGGGVILNASSFSAIVPNAGRAPYSAAKSGVSSLSKTFAAELAKDNIRVVAYVPGMIETEISAKNIAKNREALLKDIPVRRLGRPEDLAKTLVFLASDAAEYINGTNVEIAGGKRCVQNPWYSYEN